MGVGVNSSNGWPWRALGVGMALLVAACAVGPNGARPTVRAAAKSPGPRGPATASPTPAPIPSLGLLLEGRVTVEPGPLIANKLGQATERGVRIVSNHGGGLISDNGLGLISDNGLGLVANNGGNYRLAAADADGLQAVEGMWVSAVSLFDGRVLAGPVATGADGRYKLGFRRTPERNLRIVAAVPGREADARFSYSTLIPPSPAPVITSDTTRAVSGYLLSVMPGHIQPVIDAYKAGTAEPVPASEPQPVKDVAAVLQQIPQEKLIQADQDGQLALKVSERLMSFIDLSLPVYQALFDDVELIRRFAVGLEAQPEPPLLDQFRSMASRKKGLDDMPALLTRLGMPEPEAKGVTDRLNDNWEVIGTHIMLAFIAHQREVLEPLELLKD